MHIFIKTVSVFACQAFSINCIINAYQFDERVTNCARRNIARNKESTMQYPEKKWKVKQKEITFVIGCHVCEVYGR